jgi:hypothetical protein
MTNGLPTPDATFVTVQLALGNAKATTTLSTDAHLWPTAEDRTRAAAQSMLTVALAVHADSVQTGRIVDALTCEDSPFYTLKRNSTTSPSAMT